MAGTLQLIGWSGEKTKIVECFPTCSENFLITPSLSFHGAWDVSHYPSTAKVIGPFATRDLARKIAAVFAYLPLPWQSYGPDVALSGKAEYEAFLEAWKALPKSIQDWRKKVNDECWDECEREL